VQTDHLRKFRLTDTLYGFYDGRVPGQTFASFPNWVDDGALELGVCSYALVDGSDALVYDTHITVGHAARIRETVEGLGATRITVVLSHSHLDHIAGTEAFADCEVVANTLTAELLSAKRDDIEAGRLSGPPAISPLVMPTTTFTGSTHLQVGQLEVDLHQFDIHSSDATVLHIPAEGLLLAGDTVEDTVTYVSEPEGLSRHLDELERMRRLGVERIYPDHGDPGVIRDGGFRATLISATEQYVEQLLRHAREPHPGDSDLRAFIAPALDAGWVRYFAPYQRVHESNLEAVRGLG
jgi:cyclase